MHRFYLPPDQCHGPTLALDERESHHAADVLRVRRGETVTVLDGAGHEFQCQVQDVHRKSVVLTVTNKNTVPPPPCAITLIQAVPKGKTMDLIIQKATELGATRIIPLLSERVTTQLDDSGAEQKAEKWQQAVIEATKQCGQTWLPKVEVPLDTKSLIARNDQFDMAFVGSLAGDGRHPHEYFEAFRSQHKKNPTSVALWVGPEGDFTPAELEAIRGTGTLPVTFGRLVLRAETAAIYGLSVINYETNT